MGKLNPEQLKTIEEWAQANRRMGALFRKLQEERFIALVPEREVLGDFLGRKCGEIVYFPHTVDMFDYPVEVLLRPNFSGFGNVDEFLARWRRSWESYQIYLERRRKDSTPSSDSPLAIGECVTTPFSVLGEVIGKFPLFEVNYSKEVRGKHKIHPRILEDLSYIKNEGDERETNLLRFRDEDEATEHRLLNITGDVPYYLIEDLGKRRIAVEGRVNDPDYIERNGHLREILIDRQENTIKTLHCG